MDKDIQLLDTVEFRFALAKDDQLERNLTVFLTPMLLKLGSPHPQVRQKVLGILTHINKRVKSRTDVKLPVEALLRQFQDPAPSSFVKNFTTLYIEMGIARMDKAEAAEYLPQLIKGIAARPPNQRLTLLHIILSVIPQWKADPDKYDEYRSSVFHFNENSADVKVLTDFFVEILLYSVGAVKRAQKARARAAEMEMDVDGEESGSTMPPAVNSPVAIAGLSQASLTRITNEGKISWTSDALTSTKIGILNLASSGAFTDDERLILFLVATCDGNFQVISNGETGLKKCQINAETKPIINSLYELYLGSKSSDPAEVRESAPTAIKVRIINYLLRSKLATNTFPAFLQVIFDALYGANTNTRLQQAGMAFTQWVARTSDSATLRPVTGVLMSGLVKLVNENDASKNHEVEYLLGFAYVTIGLLGQRDAEYMRKDLSVLRLLFDNISREPMNVRVSIQEALSSLVTAYLRPPPALAQELETILLEQVQREEPQSRFAAVKFAIALFPFSHVASRYICLLATFHNNKLEIREEARKGLHPYWYKVLNSMNDLAKNHAIMEVDTPNWDKVTFPAFADLVKYFTSHDAPRFGSGSMKSVRGYPVDVFESAIRFIRSAMIMHSLDENALVVDESWVERLEDGISADAKVRSSFSGWLARLWDGSDRPSLETYLDLIMSGLDLKHGDATLQAASASILVELFSLGPSQLALAFHNKISQFQTLVFSAKPETRESSSHLLGIIASSELISKDDLSVIIATFLEHAANEGAQPSTYDKRHGSILALGYIISRLTFRGRKRSIQESQVQTTVDLLTKIVLKTTSSSTMTDLAAIKAIGELGRFGVFKDVIGIIKSLEDLTKKSNNLQLQEASLEALGSIGAGLPADDPSIGAILETIYNLHTTKQVELFLTSGEALANCVGGWNSKALRSLIDIGDVEPPASSRASLLKEALDKLMSEFLASGKPTLRKATTVWLLSLVQFLGDEPEIKSELQRLHSAFSMLLTDRDDFIQETASKGLNIVYRLGNDKLKKELVSSLVRSFTSDVKTNTGTTLTEDTQLFDSSMLGNAPDGSQISTYKDVMSLASDVGNPELVYRFLSLSAHSTIWNGRKGAAFGFHSILMDATNDKGLAGSGIDAAQTAKLIPKVFRYQFDPNPRLAEVMKNVWTAVAPDPKKTIEDNFSLIMAEVLKGMGERAWRTRQASCTALNELIRGRTLTELQPYLEEVWKMTFRTADDIKESVRGAAQQTTKTLTNTIVKYCDPKYASPSEIASVLDIIIPFLLGTQGMQASAKEVQAFSLNTMLKVCKTAGPQLRPHVPEIVDVLLTSLSTLESQALNYLSFHTDKYDISAEQLDTSRLASAKNSPMMEAIERCIDVVDAAALTALIPRLLHTLKRGVGVATKAGCARVLFVLSLRAREDLKPHADQIVKVLQAAIAQDANSVVRKSYASTLGYIVPLATQKRMILLVEDLRLSYLETEDESRWPIAAVTMREIAKHASENLKSIAAETMPLIYMGTFDEDKRTREEWEEVWVDNVGSSSNAVKLYLDEILQLVDKYLESPMWRTKKIAALTLTGACKVLDKGIDAKYDAVMPLLIKGLAGRTWDGKEAVLDAFVAVIEGCKGEIEKRGTLDELLKLLIREGKRNNTEYKKHAQKALQKVVDLFSERKLGERDDIKEALVQEMEE